MGREPESQVYVLVDEQKPAFAFVAVVDGFVIARYGTYNITVGENLSDHLTTSGVD